MTLVHVVDVAIGVIKVHETGRWAHINVKLLHCELRKIIEGTDGNV